MRLLALLLGYLPKPLLPPSLVLIDVILASYTLEFI
jgi:hypothetical protein